MSPTIGSAWRAWRDRFRDLGIDTAELDARLLAGQALGLDALGLALREADPIEHVQLTALDRLGERRLAGEPVARILGHREFFGLDLLIGPATLVPRPETEQVVELALQAVAGRPAARLLDLGTGSGAIPIAVLANAAHVRAVATDISADALDIARANAERHGVLNRLDLRHGDWFGPIGEPERFEIITSNPPYIETAEIAGLMREVRDFEPIAALDGGPDGLGPYKVIAAKAQSHLDAGGKLILEIGSGQGRVVAQLLESAGFGGIGVKKDLAGLDRVAVAHHVGR